MEINKHIISVLQEDSRTSYSDLGRQLNLSEGAIRKRVHNLVSKGQIKRFTIETAQQQNAIIGIRTDPQLPTAQIVNSLLKMDVNDVHETTGRYDIICFVKSGDVSEINITLEGIRTTNGVMGTETFAILKSNP